MIDPIQDIKDFLTAVDKGWLGQMPPDFNRSAFVIALRVAAASKPCTRSVAERAVL